MRLSMTMMFRRVQRKPSKIIVPSILTGHCLALERLRWTEERRPCIERNERKCRFCKVTI
ncbi:hypothetical protein BDZ97DRAFT_1826455, partial [Flammula alnicola]